MSSVKDMPADGGLQNQECSTGYLIALRIAIDDSKDAAEERHTTL